MEVVSTALYLFLKYFVIFFTAYYFTGKGLQDLSPSNIWKWIMYRVSGIGTLIYRAVTMLFYAVVRLFTKRNDSEQSIFVVLANMACVTAGLLGLVFAATKAQVILLGGLDVSVQLEEFTNEETVLSNIIGIASLIKLYTIDSELGAFGVLRETVVCILKYVMFYTVSYSILFGFMEPYMREFHFVSNIVGEDGNSSLLDDTSQETYSLRRLPAHCVKCLVNWVDNLAIMGHLYYVRVLGFVTVVVFVFSGVLVYTANGVTFSFLFGYLFSESGITGSISSFLIVTLFHLLWQVLICYVLPALVPWFGHIIYKLDSFARRDLERVQSRRRAWVANNDTISGAWENLHELHLH